MTIPYLQKRGNHWRYRRKVPTALRPIIGKGEIVIPLGTTESSALQRYGRAHAQAEKLLTQAAKPIPAPLSPTALDLFRAAHKEVEAMGFNPSWGGTLEPDDGESIARDVIIDQIIDRYKLDENGDPLNISPRDLALIRALGSGTRDTPPAPTLEDAKRLYLAEAVKDNEKRRQQLDLIFRLVSDVVKLDRPIVSIRRADAREVRDHMLDGRSPASVERYLNTLRAVINFAIKEMDLTGFQNPFMGLPTGDKEKAVPDRRKRDVFTDDELARTRAYILSNARHDIQLIWRLMQNTGCRLAEITGLRVEDVRLNDVIPHIAIEWHEKRRIKTLSSHRLVPLLGDALDAAREALTSTANGEAVFPAYFRERGPDSASAALGKYVRACVTNRKVTTYSLRHRMSDLLDLAGIPEADKELVLGHTRGKEGANYGSEAARLQRAHRALEQALSYGNKAAPRGKH
ncbi:tyrosine-type recombinase/integrase [Nitratireductor sp. GISD-1A_MAKvit]|uniref:tyrosine-type recombinase/integrase n=1 Tax=Nitratireductor sp. GISD-1A_MAKvit TaxID=3234198 RepID=UPI003467CA9B